MLQELRSIEANLDEAAEMLLRLQEKDESGTPSAEYMRRTVASLLAFVGKFTTTFASRLLGRREYITNDEQYILNLAACIGEGVGRIVGALEHGRKDRPESAREWVTSVAFDAYGASRAAQRLSEVLRALDAEDRMKQQEDNDD